MATLIGRVMTGIATAGFGGFLFTKYNSQNDGISTITKKLYSKHESPMTQKQEQSQSPFNVIIKTPDTNGVGSSTTKIIGIGAGAVIGIAVIC